MAEINLLPTKAKVDKQTEKSATLLTRIAVALGFVVIVGAVIGGGILFILNSNLNNARTAYDEVLNQVKELEATELDLVLVKDRLAKIQPLLSNRGNFDYVDRYSQIVNSLPPNAFFRSLNLKPDGSTLTLGSTDSDALSNIIQGLKNNPNYNIANIDELSFDNSKGFEITITAN